MKGGRFDYYAIYKPYGMLSQFSRDGDRETLADLYDFPGDVYPVGRLDADSEGLLILTNDKSLNSRLLDPGNAHTRTYVVQVDREITDKAISHLQSGVNIRVNKKDYRTRAAIVKRISPPEYLPERNPPVRFRKNVPTSWVEIKLTEGKNRQVRRMCAKVGFPALRLVRIGISKFYIEEMQGESIKSINNSEVEQLLT